VKPESATSKKKDLHSRPGRKAAAGREHQARIQTTRSRDVVNRKAKKKEVEGGGKKKVALGVLASEERAKNRCRAGVNTLWKTSGAGGPSERRKRLGYRSKTEH